MTVTTKTISRMLRSAGFATVFGMGAFVNSMMVQPAYSQDGMAQYPKTTSTQQDGSLDYLLESKSNSFTAIPPMATTKSTPVARQVSWQDDAQQQSIARPVYQQAADSLAKPLLPLKATTPQKPVSLQYKLANRTWKQFEKGLIAVWGNRLEATKSNNGRVLQVKLPTRGAHESATMQIDRQDELITYTGSESCLPEWKSLVKILDKPIDDFSANSAAVRIMDMKNADSTFVQQAAFELGFKQENQDPVREVVPIRGNMGGQLPTGQNPTLITQNPDETGVQGQVKIEVLQELGLIILTGAPEDVAKVKAEIERLMNAAEMASPNMSRIQLKNARASQIVDAVQEMYDENFAAGRGVASIRADSARNSLIVVGQPESVKAIEGIVELYDVESVEPAKQDFKEFRLKYMSAIDAKNRLDAYFGQSPQAQITEPLDPAPVVTIPDFRSNILVVRASAAYLKQAEELIAKFDVPDTGSIEVVKVFTLRNTVATDLALVLQDALTGGLPGTAQPFSAGGQGQGGQNQQGNQGGQGQQLNNNVSQQRAKALSIVAIGADGKKFDGGIMFDVRINAEAASNSLIVTATEKSMPLIEELINQLDRLPNAETFIKVFQIVNGDAEALIGMLNTLFGGGGAQQNNQAAGNLAQLPLQTSSAGDGTALVNLRFSFDARTNSIIVSGPQGDLEVIDTLLTRLDAQDLDRRGVSVYRLSNAPVQDVADALVQWLDARQDIIVNDPTYLSLLAQTRRQVVVVPEIVSNSLIVSALPEYYQEIEQVIQALDRRPPMVKVKVMIAEVDLNALEEFGVELGGQDALLFDRGINLNDAVFNATALTSGQNLAGQALNALGVGRSASDGGPGGLVLSAGNESINVLLRALETKGCVRVLSKPQLVTLENLQGRIQVGQRVARITDTTFTANGQPINSYSDVDIGLILEITPRVSPDGTIVLFVDAQKSSLGADADGQDIGNGVVVPPIIATEAQTAIMARSGQTVVFSGLVQESKTHQETQAPILGDLPFIGNLFRFDSDRVERSELLIVMTPYLMTDDQALEMHNENEYARMNWCMSDVSEIYGSIGKDQFFQGGKVPRIYYPDSDPMGLQPVQVGQQPELPAQPGFEGGSIREARNPNDPQLNNLRSDATATPTGYETRAVESGQRTAWRPKLFGNRGNASSGGPGNAIAEPEQFRISEGETYDGDY